MATTETALLDIVTDKYDLSVLTLVDLRCPGVMDPAITLSRTDDGYVGTFAILLDTAVEDILSDGPLLVSLKVADPAKPGAQIPVTGHLVGNSNGDYHIATLVQDIPVVVAVDREDIEHFEF